MVLYRLEEVDVVPVTQIMAEEGLVDHWVVEEDISAPTQVSGRWMDGMVYQF